METHPYSPKDLNLPGFVPNSMSQMTILSIFAAGSVVVFSLAWILPGLFSKPTKRERLLICWWTFTAVIHMIVEGYFVFSPAFYRDKKGSYLAEIWKEYSKGDSRYAGRDSAVIAVEGITAVLEGPASLLAAYALATRKPYSDVLQLAVSLGQLYGCLVYYTTAILEGDNFAASPFYYYAYYVGANASWVVIPALITIRSWKRICQSVKARDKRKSKTQ
uniref:EXPERA domain-containing protein n=1 Tax=Opuntia streptacantha TaxID=393608 RepID=A0A7C9DJF9_OPUST